MAKIITNSAGPAITYASGANHYRLIGLEVTRAPGFNEDSSLITCNGAHGPCDHLIRDQLYIHGTQSSDETVRGVSTAGVNFSADVGGWYSDFFCKTSGGCTDAQGIAGWATAQVSTTHKVVNNFIAAAAEGTIYGGAASDGGTVQQTDIEQRR